MTTRTRLVIAVALVMTGCAARSRIAMGQTLGITMGVPQYFDNNGNPLNGGKLYSYVAGTLTPLNLYTNAGLTVAYSNPLVLNTYGRAAGPVYLQNFAYKLVLTTSAGVTIWTADFQYPASLFGGGWTTNLVNTHTSPTTTDVLVGDSTDANVAANGQLHVVGTELRVYSDNAANSNYLNLRATNGAISVESLRNGTAPAIPMIFRDGHTTDMILNGTGSNTTLTIGAASGSNAGSLNVVSLTSSSTYDSQGATVNNVATTSLTVTNAYFGTATSPTPVDSGIPLFLKRSTGSFAVFQTSGSSGSLIFITSSTSGTFSSSTTSVSATLHSNATASSPALVMGVYTQSVMGTGSPGFAVTDSNVGFIFQVDSTNNSATTGMLIWHNGAIVRVGLGAADSCSAGFRCLRILN